MTRIIRLPATPENKMALQEVAGLLSMACKGQAAEARLALRRLLEGMEKDCHLHLALSRVCLELGRNAGTEAVEHARCT
jgi:hypothetical protein